jgi:hypothetical protein
MFSQTQIQSELQMSLYIPHVFPNFTSEYIASTFEFMEFGKVDHVDLVAKLDKHGKPYNAAYIHFAYWFASPTAENFQARVKDPEREARIVHDDPWFWIVLENTAKKQVPGARKERINISSDLDEISLISEDDALVTNLHNDPMDLLCEFDNEVNENELLRIKKENQLLRTTMEMHLKHANECHTKIAELILEVDELKQEVLEKECTIEDNNNLMEIMFEVVTNAKTLEEAKNEIHKDLYFHL